MAHCWLLRQVGSCSIYSDERKGELLKDRRIAKCMCLGLVKKDLCLFCHSKWQYIWQYSNGNQDKSLGCYVSSAWKLTYNKSAFCKLVFIYFSLVVEDRFNNEVLMICTKNLKYCRRHWVCWQQVELLVQSWVFFLYSACWQANSCWRVCFTCSFNVYICWNFVVSMSVFNGELNMC